MIVAYVCHVELAELLLLAVAGRPFVVVGHVFARVLARRVCFVCPRCAVD